MSDSRVPKATFYAELLSGTRPNCRPLLRFKDNLKGNLLSTGIDPATWEDLADNRSKWQKACLTGVQHFEEVRIATAVEKAADGKVLQVSPSPQSSPQIQDALPVMTAVDNSPQESALSVIRGSTGSRE